jgi:hypothetical protein
MKIRIPRKIELKLNLDKAKDVFSLIGFAFFALLTLTGLVYGIRYYRYEVFVKEKEEQCQVFTEYLKEEVLPLTEANVSDCNCRYAYEEVGQGVVSNCLCSCKLYDENGTLIDNDWNPLFSVV